jgi:hypothetical protein
MSMSELLDDPSLLSSSRSIRSKNVTNRDWPRALKRGLPSPKIKLLREKRTTKARVLQRFSNRRSSQVQHQ